MQKANVSSYIGDDGLVCTPVEAVKFLKGLTEGKLLSAASLKEMQQWVKGEDGKPIYSLGLVHYEAGCILLYIPVAKTCVFLTTNIGTLFGEAWRQKLID